MNQSYLITSPIFVFILYIKQSPCQQKTNGAFTLSNVNEVK